MNEEVLEEWVAHGYRCKTTRVTLDSGTQYYRGYVRIPLQVRRELITPLVDAHYGLTIGRDEEGWLGFDTSHSGDVNLDEDGNVINDPVAEDTEWTPSEVRVETEDLAYDLKNVVAFAEALK